MVMNACCSRQHLDAVLDRFPVLTADTKPRDLGGEHLPINILNVGLADIVKGQAMTDNHMVAVLQPYIMQNRDKVGPDKQPSGCWPPLMAGTQSRGLYPLPQHCRSVA
jgi:hypothetical protein